MLMLNPSHPSPKSRFEAQSALMNDATGNEDICGVLELVGQTIDDLVYRNSSPIAANDAKPPMLNSFKRTGKGIPLVSFFTGCGGMDLGFEAVGFKHEAAFEFNEVFCQTLRINRPKWKVFGPPFENGDVSKTEEVIEQLTPVIQSPFDGIFVGGPPCQPFSIASNQRFSKSGKNFKRVGFAHEKNGNLLFNFVDLIVHFRPAAFVIENVPGLRDVDDGKQLGDAMTILSRAGYNVEEPKIWDAADHGVPQYRQRLFLVGTRTNGKFSMPDRREHIGSGSVLSELPGPDVHNHDTRRHKVASVSRYRILDYGKRDHLGRVDRRVEEGHTFIQTSLAP